MSDQDASDNASATGSMPGFGFLWLKCSHNGKALSDPINEFQYVQR